ncbi:RNA polymerase sigma factor [Candidatus Daviesbacteria bacterium]|nr:RNA polymerase sigma factor [Candidatus Daviesbacteria bacterium]
MPIEAVLPTYHDYTRHWRALGISKPNTPFEAGLLPRKPPPAVFDNWPKDTVKQTARLVCEQNSQLVKPLLEITGPYTLRPFHRGLLAASLDQFSGNWPDTLTQVGKLPQYQDLNPLTLVRALRFGLNALLGLEDYPSGHYQTTTLANHGIYQQEAQRVRTFVQHYPNLWDQIPEPVKDMTERFFVRNPPDTQTAIARNLDLPPYTVTRYIQKVVKYVEYILSQDKKLQNPASLLPASEAYQPLIDYIYARVTEALQQTKVAAEQAPPLKRRVAGRRSKTQRPHHLPLLAEAVTEHVPLSPKQQNELYNKLVLTARRSDQEEAMEVLFREIYPILRGWSRTFTRNNPDLVEEVTAEAAVKIWQRLDTYHPEEEGTFKSWAMVITRCTAVDLIRQETRHHRRLGCYLEERFADDPGQPAREDFLVDPDIYRDRQPEGAFSKSTVQQFAHQAINQIPNPDQKLVAEYRLAGLSYREIAQLTQIPLGTIKSMIRLAKSQILAYLAKQGMNSYSDIIA